MPPPATCVPYRHHFLCRSRVRAGVENGRGRGWGFLAGGDAEGGKERGVGGKGGPYQSRPPLPTCARRSRRTPEGNERVKRYVDAWIFGGLGVRNDACLANNFSKLEPNTRLRPRFLAPPSSEIRAEFRNSKFLAQFIATKHNIREKGGKVFYWLVIVLWKGKAP
jgi:hypothetical protein